MADKTDKKGNWQTPEEFIAHEAARISGGKENLRLPNDRMPPGTSDEPAVAEPDPDRNYVFEFKDTWRKCPACRIPVPHSVFVEPLTWRVFFRRYRKVKPHAPFSCPTCKTKLSFQRPIDARMPWHYVVGTAALTWTMVLTDTPAVLTDELGEETFLFMMPIFVYSAIRHYQRILTVAE